MLVVTGATTAALVPPFCMELEEDISPLYDGPAPGGGKFAIASCALKAIVPTKDEDWLAGKEGSTETEVDPTGATVVDSISRTGC